MKVTKKGMEAIANLRDCFYNENKTMLTQEDIKMLKLIDKIEEAYEELFIAYAQEKLSTKED